MHLCNTFFSRYSPGSTSLLFFFNDPAPHEIYTLSLHDALPILEHEPVRVALQAQHAFHAEDVRPVLRQHPLQPRSEEHTSELQSRVDLVCRLLLEKKKKSYNSRRFAGAAVDDNTAQIYPQLYKK